MTPVAISRWFEFMEHGRDAVLDDLLAEDVVFHSPAVHTPKRGRELVASYLRAAEHLFTGTDFRYVATWFAENSAVLEFVVDLDGVHVEGVDIITWSAENQITAFKVMVRPLKALQTVMVRMGGVLVDMGVLPPPGNPSPPTE